MRKIAAALLVFSASILHGQTTAVRPTPTIFDVATIKQVDPGAQAGRFFKMEGNNRFIAHNFSLKLLIAAAYDLNPKTISGGPSWIDSDKYDILATTPGEVRPAREQQMTMLRGLLVERFQLKFHREPKDFSIYTLAVAKDGPKLRKSASPPDDSAALISTVYPQKIFLPARNASMDDFVALLQRAVLDRPVVNKTGLSGKFDFDLEWAPDETQFGGEVPVANSEAPSLPLFVAVQQQLGLKLEATRGPVSTLVIDAVERPGAN